MREEEKRDPATQGKLDEPLPTIPRMLADFLASADQLRKHQQNNPVLNSAPFPLRLAYWDFGADQHSS